MVRSFPVLFQFAPDGSWESSSRLDGIRCSTRTLAAGRSALRRALAQAHGCEEGEVELEETFELPGGLSTVVDEVRASRTEAERRQRLSVDATREAVARIAEAAPEMGMRDIASLVGVSYQRVQQLLQGR